MEKDNFLEKLYQITNKIVEEAERNSSSLQQVNIDEYLASLNTPEKQLNKDFFLSVLGPLESLEFALRRNERHMHVAVARFMEVINALHEKKYFLINLHLSYPL